MAVSLPREECDELIDERLAAAAELRPGHAAERVRHHRDARGGEALRRGLLACERRKALRRHHHRRDSQLLEPCRVVETPRRARASIRAAGERELRLRAERTQELDLARRGGGALLLHA